MNILNYFKGNKNDEFVEIVKKTNAWPCTSAYTALFYLLRFNTIM